ncbi:MAG TPA: ABC transporter permease subunit [Feifaniaceae bacterium]|nr:ABC transporter permease subunit [Feifaniaceae bacterium]
MKVKRTYLFAMLPFALLILLFEFAPVFAVILRSFKAEESLAFTLEHYSAIFTKPLYQQAVFNSVAVSVASSLVGMAAAFFGAKAANAASSRLKAFFMSVLNMCSNFAGLPLAFAFIIMFGNVGVFVLLGKQFSIPALAGFNIYGLPGLMLTYIYFQIPLCVLLLIPAFDGLRKEWRESVSLLGGSSFHYWTKVGLPALLPSLLGTFSVLFSNALAAYATAYALLQGNFSLLPIRISEQFVGDMVQRREFGSALAVVMMLLMVVSVLCQSAVLKRAKGAAK